MIVLVDPQQNPERRARFLDAVRGRPYFGDLLPVELAVFGAMHGAPVPRFFTATPNAALCIRGRGALLCGTYDTQETGGFLQLHGVEHVQTDGAPPAGYAREKKLFCMAYSGGKASSGSAFDGRVSDGSASDGRVSDGSAFDGSASDGSASVRNASVGKASGRKANTAPLLAPPKTPAVQGKTILQTVPTPPLPSIDSFDEPTVFGIAPDAASLPLPPIAGLTLDTAPPPGETADFLMRAKGVKGAKGEKNAKDVEIRDNFYSELCTKLARGAACVWAVRQAVDETGDGPGKIIASAGAYALSDETAYLAAIETAEPLRGRGIGSRLVGTLATQLAGEGRRVALLCAENRVPFYERLGFRTENTIWRCTQETEV